MGLHDLYVALVVGLEIDGDPRHLEVIRMGAKHFAELPDSAVDRGAAHPEPLHPLEAALQMPAKPEAEQLGDHGRRDFAGDGL